MDYCAVFRPIFVYVTHLARNQAGETRIRFPLSAIRADLQTIILDVFQTQGSSSREFDQAWFAVRCWLGETLAPLPYARELCDRLVDIPENGGSVFFLRLNRLLEENAPDLVKIHAACLELGFKGYYARPGHEADLAGYRAACRRLLQAAPPATPPPPARARLPYLREGVLRAAAWLAPAAITLLLYCLYRLMLRDLYTAVVG